MIVREEGKKALDAARAEGRADGVEEEKRSGEASLAEQEARHVVAAREAKEASDGALADAEEEHRRGQEALMAVQEASEVHNLTLHPSRGTHI